MALPGSQLRHQLIDLGLELCRDTGTVPPPGARLLVRILQFAQQGVLRHAEDAPHDGIIVLVLIHKPLRRVHHRLRRVLHLKASLRPSPALVPRPSRERRNALPPQADAAADARPPGSTASPGAFQEGLRRVRHDTAAASLLPDLIIGLWPSCREPLHSRAKALVCLAIVTINGDPPKPVRRQGVQSVEDTFVLFKQMDDSSVVLDLHRTKVDPLVAQLLLLLNHHLL
mmetsp:Transcript_28068/g.67424  ORF Transcript_28068/g.67424 Transcript_28068/m.67424 type:complete len:228 (+) Transcript_28068:699-1382(+)